MEDDADLREQLFHNTVRENIIFFLLFLVLCVSSYALIARFRRRDREDYFSVDEDEATVYKISLWLCTVALAVSVGATLLLPVSIASNEVLILYPNSYYVKWLNSSLIQGLWNHVFLFSNLSLFVFLPFAYLFTESEGFVGYRNVRSGVMARVYETVTVLCLLGTLVLGMTYVLSALVDYQISSLHLLNLWSYYLPFLYSCVSFVGVVMLLLCTPMGFVRLFEVVGSFLVKPQFLKNLDEEFFAYRLEEDCIRRRGRRAAQPKSEPDVLEERRSPARIVAAIGRRSETEEDLGSAKADLVGSTHLALPLGHAGATYIVHCHGSPSGSKHVRAADRYQSVALEHEAIHSGHYFTVEAGTCRSSDRSICNFVFSRYERDRSVHPARRQVGSTSASFHAAYSSDRQLRSSSCTQLGVTATISNIRYDEL
ncbi:protein Lilipod isoform X9 [Ceratina calcarata]|uniref:Protein Lilipod isoform X9 n=1 Tax=Ceratina calcarata TaxID=156304 RepID=A0AAJ7JDT2_9HYME|nr:protein Lilipod isoform X9 [Ceratina calcarata]